MQNDIESAAKRIMLPLFGTLLFLPVIAIFFTPETNWIAFVVRFLLFAGLMYFSLNGVRWAHIILLSLLLLGGFIGLIAGMQGNSNIAVIHLLLGMINLAGALILFRSKAIKAFITPPKVEAELQTDINNAIEGQLEEEIKADNEKREQQSDGDDAEA